MTLEPHVEQQPATPHEKSRTVRLLNVLAVIIGVVSGVIGVACAIVALVTFAVLLRQTADFPADWTGLGALGVCAGMSFLGFLFASRALLHLRHPNAGTARDMIGTALYMIVMGGVLPLGARLHAPALLLFGAPIVLYFIHGYLVDQVSAQAFPAHDGAPTSTSAT